MKLSQLSLLNIFCLVTTAGALFAFYSARQRNQQIFAANETIKAGMAVEIGTLRTEIKTLENVIKAREKEAVKLKEEFGFLTIADKSKIHAIAVPFVQQPRTWVYRVSLPEGNEYFAACKINDLPLENERPEYDFKTPGTATIAGGRNSSGIGLSSGEYLITISVFMDRNRYRYSFDCKATTGTHYARSGLLISVGDDKWPVKADSFATTGVTWKATIAPPDAPLILLDGRSFGEKVKSSNESTEGIIAWIETVPHISE